MFIKRNAGRANENAFWLLLCSHQASNDRVQWVNLLETIVDDFPHIHHIVEIEIPRSKMGPFKHYRIYVIKTGWSSKGLIGGYVQVRALRMC